MEICVRHRTASGDARRGWSYSDADRTVHVSLVEGSASLSFDVHVCSLERPLVGHNPVVRLGAEEWRVLPLRYVREWPGGVEALRPMRCPVSDSLPYGASLVLTNAPDDASVLLSEL